MQPSRVLYQDFPVEIRQLYGEVTQMRDLHERHMGLLEFSELALTYFASISVSDYRSRYPTPDVKVESFLERAANRNLTMGSLLELFRLSVQAIPDPLVPAPKQFATADLRMLRRFVAAVTALEVAIEGQSPGFHAADVDVRFHVSRGLEADGLPAVDWWTGWGRLVEFRNRVVHSSKSRWPIRDPQFWEVMTPLLHGAVVDLLTEPLVVDAVLGHPVVSLTLATRTDEALYSHAVCGEDSGIWFEAEIVAAESVTGRWGDDSWEATTASPLILDKVNGDWAIRGLFWDLRNGLPPVRKLPWAGAGVGSAGPSLQVERGRPDVLEGSGVAPGTCGEFAQGVLLDGTPFHVTCPINTSATVLVKIRAASELSIVGLSTHHRKLGVAIEDAIQAFDLGPVEVVVRHWSDIDIGKGMGSSTADVLAGIRAVADAAGKDLESLEEGRLAAKVESSDGSMYPGLAAVNHRTCELVRSWDWYPEFAIVMLVPHENVDTPSIRFTGQEKLAPEYEDLLGKMDKAIARRSIGDFAEQSTRSAVLNNRFRLNPYCSQLQGQLVEFGALGLNVGHTGTVCGLLFPNSEEGWIKASEACFEVRERFPDLKDVKVVTTPYCGLSSGEERGEAD